MGSEKYLNSFFNLKALSLKSLEKAGKSFAQVLKNIFTYTSFIELRCNNSWNKIKIDTLSKYSSVFFVFFLIKPYIAMVLP